MPAYGDMIIASDTDPVPETEVFPIVWRQAVKTWQELGEPSVISFKMWSTPMDEGCLFFDEEEGVPLLPHGEGPHTHYAWKMKTADK
jgi:hypothetical protein